MPIPPLRPLDVFPAGDEKRPLLAMRDPMGVVEGVLVVQPEAFFIASQFDGEADADGLARLMSLRMGAKVDEALVLSVAQQFSERGLLFDAKFQQLYEAAVRAFAEAPLREATHAGGNYPEEPDALRDLLQQIVAQAAGAPRPRGKLLGLVAPHIDFERGHPTYALAYQALAQEEPFDRVLLLGTSHGPVGSLLVPTRKDFATPLGVLKTCRPAVDAMVGVLGDECLQDEFAHRAEHSLEFQAVFLKWLQPNTEIVPVLCGGLRGWVDDGADPAANDDVEKAVAALRAALQGATRPLILAGADLAHVGPRFGGPELNDHVLAVTEQGDRAALEVAATRDAAGWYRAISDGGDARNTCGLSPIYFMLRVLDRGEGKLLGYRRCESPDQCVTIGAMTFTEKSLLIVSA